MSTLEGQTVANTYKDLLQIPNSNQGVPLGDQNPVPLEDGTGTKLPISFTGDDTGSLGAAKVVIGKNELLPSSGADTLTSGISALAEKITLQAEDEVNIITPTGTVTQEADVVDIAGATDLNLIGGVKILGGFGNGQLTTNELEDAAGAPNGVAESTRTIVYAGGLIPNSNATYDIGSAEFKVRHLFLSDNSLYISNPDTANNVDFYKLSIDANGGSRTLTMSTSSSTTTESVSSVIQPQSYEIVEQELNSIPNIGDTRCTQIQSSITNGGVDYNMPAPEYLGQEKKIIFKSISTNANAQDEIGPPKLIGTFVGGESVTVSEAGGANMYEQINLICVSDSDVLKWYVQQPDESRITITIGA